MAEVEEEAKDCAVCKCNVELRPEQVPVSGDTLDSHLKRKVLFSGLES